MDAAKSGVNPALSRNCEAVTFGWRTSQVACPVVSTSSDEGHGVLPAFATSVAVPALVSGVLDEFLREPPPAVHPVVWMGRYLDGISPLVPAAPAARARTRGALAWLAGLLVTTAVAWWAERLCRSLPPFAGAAVRGLLLWPLWSGRMLTDEVAAVESAVSASTDGGRRALARIVSRDTSLLGPSAVRGAAIQSLAENLSDSVVAPLMWFAAGGLPGAAAYRYVNTADAMWGYRSDRWRHAGSTAARADDLCNLAPARVTAALMMLGAPWRVWRRLPRQARLTPSPNSGWPMAAAALRLGLRLEKPGVYVLNHEGRDPGPGDVHRALHLLRPDLFGRGRG